MNSKKALEKLNVKCIRSNGVDDEYFEEFNIIKKDLDVLEILKPMLEIKKGSTWEYLDTKHCFFDTQEQIEIIKEWLEDEK